MRQALRVLGIACWSLVYAETGIAILDWFSRWDWLKAFMVEHPHFATLIRTPFSYLLLLILGFLFLSAERRLKQPRIVARFVNSRIIPNLKTTTIKAVLDSDAKTPGWEAHKLDWEWFIETQLANDAETPTTIEEVRVRISIKRKWWKREAVKVERSEDFNRFLIDMGIDKNLKGHSFEGERYRKVSSLMEKIRNVPLTKGIGYRGWLRFKVNQVNQKDMNGGRILVDVWLIDALEGKHKLNYKRKSEETWDNGFYLFKDFER